MLSFAYCRVALALCVLCAGFDLSAASNGKTTATVKGATTQASSNYDVVVFGATPCGIAAALAAARYGRHVALIATGKHIGGMMSSGLSITDVRFPNAFGGIYREFIDRSAAYYTTRYGRDSRQLQDSNNGLWFEPSTAEALFEEMVRREPNVTLLRDHRLVRALKTNGKVDGLIVASRENNAEATLRAPVTVDATYEGDAAVSAGVKYRVGREARNELYEPYAGKVFLRTPGMQLLPGSTGEGDERVQAYNYRLCMTPRPELRIVVQRPANYRREDYAPLVEMIRRGDLGNIQDVIRVAPIANDKFSANNASIVRSLDLPEDNRDYPDGTEERRAQIVGRYRDYTLGLIWFLQNDSELPERFHNTARPWGLCKDEFTDNGHVPYELYVREARRIRGRKTFTAFDSFLRPGSERAPVHSDSIAVADYHVDSHLVQRQKPGFPQMEGHVYLRPLSKVAQVPYGVIIPEGVEGMLVPGAMSATHLGFGVLRMEPVWMALGQAAGTAAHLALKHNVAPSAIPVTELQRRLLEAGQVITFFHDQPGPDPVWMQLNRPAERSRITTSSDIPVPRYSPGIQFFGTKGFFDTYYARPFDPVTRSEAVRWLTLFTKLEGIKFDDQKSKHTLPDVAPTHADYSAITSLMNAGIVENWAETEGFFPHAGVSRADAARWIVRVKLRTSKWKMPDNTPQSPASRWTDLPANSSDFPFFALLTDMNTLPAMWLTAERIQPLFYVTREEFCDMLFAAHSASEP